MQDDKPLFNNQGHQNNQHNNENSDINDLGENQTQDNDKKTHKRKNQ